MQLLQEVDKPGSDVEEYARSLDGILSQKMEVISALRSRLNEFQTHLKQEKDLTKKFHDQQNDINDVFDLRNSPKGEMEDPPLLTEGLDKEMCN
jgi:predicted RNase H-like nuclease (RuvC/YqgF family)